jgi:hypothetical protein
VDIRADQDGQVNSWEDLEFRGAVEATGRKKLIMTALWTEVCLAFPMLDALREGYEVYPVVDAVGETSAKHTMQVSSASFKLGRDRSVGCRPRVNCSATGLARTPSWTSSTSSSRRGSSRTSEGGRRHSQSLCPVRVPDCREVSW